MRLPRDSTGAELVERLARLGYVETRQTGSHIRLTCQQPSQHHVTVPRHDPLRVGTLAAVLSAVAEHHRMSRDDLIRMLME